MPPQRAPYKILLRHAKIAQFPFSTCHEARKSRIKRSPHHLGDPPNNKEAKNLAASHHPTPVKQNPQVSRTRPSSGESRRATKHAKSGPRNHETYEKFHLDTYSPSWPSDDDIYPVSSQRDKWKPRYSSPS